VEAFVGAVGHGGQPEIDQRELRRLVELSQQAHAAWLARIAHHDLEILSRALGQGFRDERIVVDESASWGGWLQA